MEIQNIGDLYHLVDYDPFSNALFFRDYHCIFTSIRNKKSSSQIKLPTLYSPIKKSEVSPNRPLLKCKSKFVFSAKQINSVKFFGLLGIVVAASALGPPAAFAHERTPLENSYITCQPSFGLEGTSQQISQSENSKEVSENSTGARKKFSRYLKEKLIKGNLTFVLKKSPRFFNNRAVSLETDLGANAQISAVVNNNSSTSNVTEAQTNSPELTHAQTNLVPVNTLMQGLSSQLPVTPGGNSEPANTQLRRPTGNRRLFRNSSGSSAGLYAQKSEASSQESGYLGRSQELLQPTGQTATNTHGTAETNSPRWLRRFFPCCCVTDAAVLNTNTPTRVFTAINAEQTRLPSLTRSEKTAQRLELNRAQNNKDLPTLVRLFNEHVQRTEKFSEVLGQVGISKKPSSLPGVKNKNAIIQLSAPTAGICEAALTVFETYFNGHFDRSAIEIDHFKNKFSLILEYMDQPVITRFKLSHDAATNSQPTDFAISVQDRGKSLREINTQMQDRSCSSQANFLNEILISASFADAPEKDGFTSDQVNILTKHVVELTCTKEMQYLMSRGVELNQYADASLVPVLDRATESLISDLRKAIKPPANQTVIDIEKLKANYITITNNLTLCLSITNHLTGLFPVNSRMARAMEFSVNGAINYGNKAILGIEAVCNPTTQDFNAPIDSTFRDITYLCKDNPQLRQADEVDQMVLKQGLLLDRAKLADITKNFPAIKNALIDIENKVSSASQGASSSYQQNSEAATSPAQLDLTNQGKDPFL